MPVTGIGAMAGVKDSTVVIVEVITMTDPRITIDGDTIKAAAREGIANLRLGRFGMKLISI